MAPRVERVMPRRAALAAVLLLFAPVASAQPGDAQVRRLRGIVHRDETWAGRIVITDDLKILGATVTVRPGTRIEFAHSVAGSHPVLTVGSPSRDRAELKLLSDADHPIVFRSLPETNAGRIVVHVRDRIVTPAAVDSAPDRPPPAPSIQPAGILWQHVRFEDLGHPREGRRAAARRPRTEPAVAFVLSGRSHRLSIVDCEFTNTTRLDIRADRDARIRLERNRVRDVRGRAAFSLHGSPIRESPPDVLVADNRLGAALLLDGAPATLRGNILVGPHAAIVLRDDTARRTTVTGNYIHNTTDADDGRYCLDSHNPNATLSRNIFRGGTTCVLSGSRHMSGNVFIGADRLAGRIVKQSHTHQCVAALPVGARFERNLLIGPAYALLVPQPLQTRPDPDAPGEPTRLWNNIFDGLGRTARAVHLNPIGQSPADVSLANNLFLRVDALVHDEGGSTASLIYADHNACAPMPKRPFDRARVAGLEPGRPGWAGHDVRAERIADLGLSQAPPDQLPDFDTDLLSGALSVEQLRVRLFSAYRPRPESPLVAAGRPAPDRSGAAPRTIGALEPGPLSP